jgi:aminoglycoside phosphotransferase (APT) family kinase protein
MTLSIDDLKVKLEDYLTEQTGQTAKVQEMKPLAGGASRDSYAVTLTLDDATEKMVLRKDLPTTMHDKALSRRQEFDIMQAAYDAGVKVARMRFHCADESVLGEPFFLMDFVEGISIGRKVIKEPSLEHARAILPEQLAEQLAKIHTIPYDTFDFLHRPAPGQTAAQDVIKETYSILDGLGAHVTAFEFALRWAERNAPTDDTLTYIHGDYRIGNLLIDENGLAAVIDWEFGHIGHPAEEIGYLCMRDWRFGNYHLHAGGLSPRERFIQAYEAASGRTIDRAAADWWEIIGNIRWGIICLAQADRHLSGRDPSVELASLGRRSAEMQLEALRLIEKVGLD